MKVDLSPEELALLCDALDSHVYWELSDPQYRDSGYVADPGADDVERKTDIGKANALLERLHPLCSSEDLKGK